MGLLSDFLVADRTDANAIADNRESDRWTKLELTGFTSLEVSLLHFAITGDDADAPVSPSRFVDVGEGQKIEITTSMAYDETFDLLVDGGEAWVWEIPSALCRGTR
ncbi:MAG: hypothetical protein ACRELY_06405 [Polyangiaceae bacterium]